jgi:RimJ/RimL family protein N-acetyltransferase
MASLLATYKPSLWTNRAEIDVVLLPRAEGKGIGVAAVRILAKQLKSNGYPKITVDPRVAHTRAVRAFEKAGFRTHSQQSAADQLITEFSD